MRVLIDANVIADALLEARERPQGDRDNAQLILEAVARRRITGLTTPPIFVFITHLVKPRRSSHRVQVEKALAFLLDILEWMPVTPDHCRTAISSTFKDVEDGIQFFACGRLDVIVTRDVLGFREHVHVPVLTPAQFVTKYLR